MIKIAKTRMAQGRRTAAYPKQPPLLPDRFLGLPVIATAACPSGCRACIEACPVAAVRKNNDAPEIDMSRCLFCGACAGACPEKTISFSTKHELAARTKGGLLVDGSVGFRPAAPLASKLRRLLGRSLRLRQVSAGGCNACEADTNVLNTLVFDLSRFGIQFVASPRHADGLLVTGPVTRNMELALRKTYDTVPAPKIVIAVGACAISGGMFAEHEEVHRGVDELLPVDLYIPGCPPHPYTILDGLLRLLGRQTPPIP
jgi:Ni,Fe-hydrogenase III small subunit/Pyruvate/2-oxoacid:ferredoxin oxidoreductase delta subunit